MKQMAINRSCCHCFLYSVVHKFRNKAGRVFSDSSVFPAKFPDISKFCGHPELSHLRKINWADSSPFMQALCSMICLNILYDRLTELQQNSYLRDGHRMGISMDWIGLGESVLIFCIYHCR